MKIFEDYGSKVNFVDDNNVFVGYDLSQSCCENADWFISKLPIEFNCDTKISKNFQDLEDYVFDTTYFEEREGGDLYEGKMVIFRLTAKDKPDIFLHLYNCHNGYYGHGFEAKINGIDWKNDCL